MIKLDIREAFQKYIVRDRAERLSRSAEVMLSLKVVRLGDEMVHDLHLALLGLGVFRHQDDGRPIPYVAKSGIVVPDPEEVVATIRFYAGSSAKDPSFVERRDSVQGRIYAKKDEILAAWDAVDERISALEEHVVCVRDCCPDALSDREGPALVSVDDYWRYFKRFRHDADGRDFPDCYHTYWKHKKGLSRFELISGGSNVISLDFLRY